MEKQEKVKDKCWLTTQLDDVRYEKIMDAFYTIGWEKLGLSQRGLPLNEICGFVAPLHRCNAKSHAKAYSSFSLIKN